MSFHLSLTWWSPQGQRGSGKAGRQWSAADPAVLSLHPQPCYYIHATSASLHHCRTEGERKGSLVHTTVNWHPSQTVILTLLTLASIRNWSVVQVSVVGRCRRRVWLICSRFARIRHSYKSHIWWEGRWENRNNVQARSPGCVCMNGTWFYEGHLFGEYLKLFDGLLYPLQKHLYIQRGPCDVSHSCTHGPVNL